MYGIHPTAVLKHYSLTEAQALEKVTEYIQRKKKDEDNIRDAKLWAVRTQEEINNRPKQKYGCIVAVDLQGAFSKDNKIPWRYPDDFKWFHASTKGHICVMGRATYDSITEEMGLKGDQEVLPGRKTFVVTSTPLQKDNAIAVSCIGDIDVLLTDEDRTKTIWFCGGESVYREGIALCSELYITVVNKLVNGDRYFPTKYTLKNFDMDKQFIKEESPDLLFTTWKRKI